MYINYKNNLKQLRKQQIQSLERNMVEIDELLMNGEIAKAYLRLLYEAHTDYMKTFAVSLLGREVSEVLADSRYKILINDYYISFYNSKVKIKFSMIPGSLEILIIGSCEKSDLASRAKNSLSQFIDEDWEIKYL